VQYELGKKSFQNTNVNTGMCASSFPFGGLSNPKHCLFRLKDVKRATDVTLPKVATHFDCFVYILVRPQRVPMASMQEIIVNATPMTGSIHLGKIHKHSF